MQYATLLEQRKHLTGYFLEKADKQIQELAKKIIADKNLISHITQISPKTIKQVISQAKYDTIQYIER